jgi:hypothetical protein
MVNALQSTTNRLSLAASKFVGADTWHWHQLVLEANSSMGVSLKQPWHDRQLVRLRPKLGQSS